MRRRWGRRKRSTTMRHDRRSAVHTWALCLVTVVAAAGCSSGPKGPSRTAKAVESLNDTRKHLADASKQVTATNDSLRVLSEASSGDLRPLFNKFAANVKKTEDA